MQSDPRRAPGLRTIAVVTVGSAFLSAGAHAQDGESREPGTLNKAYEALVGDLRGACSRRINIQHRLVYQVLEEERIVKVLRLWSHYE